MGGKNVKNTIIERVLQLVAPHPCYSCGKNGPILCDYCKFNIVSERYFGCVLCGSPQVLGICEKHQAPFQHASVVGERREELRTLIDRLKFHNTKAAAFVLAELLHETAPLYDSTTIVVPIPTLRAHIRERGYDHVALIAERFALLRGLRYEKCLVRRSKAVQRLAKNKTERVAQAATAFALDPLSVNTTDKTILIVDDIITTGSTVVSAARLFSRAKAVNVAALAYHPLD